MSAEVSLQPKRKFRQKFRLRTTLVVPFVLQIVAAVGLVGYLSFRNGQKAVEDLAHQLSNEVTARIVQQITTYLALPHQINQFNEIALRHTIRQNRLNLTKPLNAEVHENFKRYALEQLRKFEGVSYISIGTEASDFVGVERYENSSILYDRSGQLTGYNLENWKIDKQDNLIQLLKREPYNPRVRPWYKKSIQAGKPIWSDIYAYAGISKNLVVSLSQPYYSEQGKLLGVINSDIKLVAISDFLKTLQIGKTGQAFIVERNGFLVGASSDEALFRLNPVTQQLDRLSAKDSRNVLMAETTAYLLKQFNNLSQVKTKYQLDFPLRGERHFLTVLPYKDEKGLDWLIVIVVPETDFMGQINKNTRLTIWLCLVALVVAIIIGILTARWITRPLLRVSKASQKIAQGELEQHVVPTNIIEIERLANSFNSMARQLQQSFATLEKQNENLKRLDQLKDEFLANTSHELRTPLNGIIGIAESLIDGATGELPESTQANLSLIVSSGRRLSNLVNDILDFSKLRHKNLELQLKPVDLRAITNVVLTLLHPLVISKNLQLINAIPAELPPAHADENRLQQILYNLIGNAIKFTPSGTVVVKAEVVNQEQLSTSLDLAKNENPIMDLSPKITSNSLVATSQIIITISDTGIGISEEKLDRIFESFEQAEGSTTREYGGTGLGLAVTKQLVELHGGEISVKSKVGEGSQFTFTLPISQGNLESTQPIAPILGSLVLELAAPMLSQHSGSRTPNEKQFKVLIVDDEPINRQVLVNNLSLYNYALTEVSNGQEALTVIEQGFMPDLILLDVMMPHMTGYEVCQKIRDRFPAHELPIVMLTAKNQVSDIVEGFESGANDYLCKPIQKQEMLARIKTHLYLAKLTLAYGRFVPHNFLKFLEKESIIDVQLGDQVQQEMTILFSDIRSFTSLSETMSPQETFNFVNSYLSRVSPLIRQHKGFIDKYIGDAIMALFPESANDALEAAIAMQKAVVLYNQHRQNQGYVPIAIGIGLHTGNLMLGTIGESERMETTVIADAVNLASRLEGLTKLYGVGILISEHTLAQLGNLQNYSYRFLDRVRVQGKNEPVAVYEVYEEDLEPSNSLKTQTRTSFEQAVIAYSQQDFIGAQQLFQEILAINPQDRAAFVYVKRCQHYQQHGVPVDWDGITDLDFK